SFTPGRVGGHCIGVDPYYLTFGAQKAGYHPDVILAGRRINDSIGIRVARECLRRLLKSGTQAPRVTVLGLTFKENVVDIRNSQVIDIIRELQSFGVSVQVNDPFAEDAAALREYGLTLQKEPQPADAVVLAVAHDAYRKSGWPLITRLLKDGRGLVMDVKGALDPMSRDSGPAVAVSAVLAAERDRNALVLVLAADHVVRKPEEFHAACRLAAAAAGEGRIVTFGIEPTHPATSYGYIRPGEKLNGASARTVDAFVEKPDAATAANYVAERYLWNSGNFLFHAATMLGEIERFEPVMAEAAKAAVAGFTRDLDFLRLASEPFARAPKKSIDYAVMQRTKLAVVIPTDPGWSDIGSWRSVWEVLA